MLSCVYREEVWHAALLRLYNSSHLLGLWQWCLLSEIQGLACHVFPQNTWLLANLFSLFSACIKLPIFHFRWGCEAVLRCYFFLLHTHHLWSLGISDKFPDCPKCRLVNTQGDQDPSLGLSLFVWQYHRRHWSTEHWCHGLCVFGEPARALHCSQGVNVGTSLWTYITGHSLVVL